MARLGELLVAAGLVTTDQVEHGLRAQVMWGGRLGTNLVELGYLDLDELARMLGRQHRLPPALARHFERADPALQQLLPPAVAERYSAVPLFCSGKLKDRIVVVSSLPLAPEAIAHLAHALDVPAARLLPAIAAELRIAYHLERVYQIPRDLRFLRPRNKSVPAFLHFEIIPVPPDSSEPDLVIGDTQELPVLRPPPPRWLVPAPAIDLNAPEPALGLGDEDTTPPPASFDDTRIGREPREPRDYEDTGEHERRRYVRTITDELAAESEPHTVGRIALRRIAVAGAPGAAGASLVEAVRTIRRSTDRDRVADLVLDALDRFVPACEAAILLVKRGDVAISWKGFARGGHELPQIAVPIGGPTPPGLVSVAIDAEATVRARAADLGPVDQLLRRSLGDTGDELAIVPISIGGQVMCAIALTLAPGAGVEAAEALAGAAGTAFARLMAAASR
jgi:Type II secretion system (T2SS), protein E, N-terminal domain